MASKFISGLGWLGASKLIGQLVSWSVTLFMFRLLGPADYALIAMCGTVTLLLTMLADFGLGAALVHAKELNKDILSTVFGAALLLALLLVASVWISAPAIASYYRAPEIKLLIELSSLQLIAGALLTPAIAQINHEGNYRSLAILEITQSLTASTATLILGLLGLGVISIVGGTIIGVFGKSFLAQLLCRVRVWPSLNIGQSRTHIKFGSGLLATNFIGYLASQSYILIGARVLSREEMGFFSVALELAHLPLAKLMGIINQVAYPEIARKSREGKVPTTELLFGFSALFIILYPIFTGIGSTASLWIPLLIGDQWAAATPVLQICCITMLFQAGASLNNTLLLGLGLMRHSLLSTVAYAAVTLSLVILATRWNTAVALGTATLVAAMFSLFYTAHRARHQTGFDAYQIIRASWKPTLAAAVMLVVILGLLHFGAESVASIPILLVCALSLGGCTYLALLLFSAQKELRVLIEFAKK